MSFPRSGALLITRDERSGTQNIGNARAPGSRNDLFGFGDQTNGPLTDLSGNNIFSGPHDLDCGICDIHRAGRLLLCCEFCPQVAHIRCARLLRVPQGRWLCHRCTASRLRPAASPVPTNQLSSGSVQSRSPAQPTPAPVPAPVPISVPGSPQLPPPAQPALLQELRSLPDDPSDVDEPLPLRDAPAALPQLPEDISDIDEPILQSNTRAASRQRADLLRDDSDSSSSAPPLRMGSQVDSVRLATAMSSVTGKRHLSLPSRSALADRVLRRPPFPVPFNDLGGDDLLVRSSVPGLRDGTLREPAKVGGDPFSKLHRVLSAGNAPRAPLPAIRATGDYIVNPQAYPLYANAAAGNEDPQSRKYSSFAGYSASEPRLGQGFKLDPTRASRQGLTLPEAMRSPHAAQFAAADKRERDVLLSSGSLKIVPRASARGYKITFRHLCSFKPHKLGDKQFDVRLCLQGFRQPKHSYDPDRVSTAVARTESVKLTMAWALSRNNRSSSLSSAQGDATRAFLQAPLTNSDGDLWCEAPASWEIPEDMVLQVVNSIYGLKQSCYNWCEKLDGVLERSGAIPFLQDPRSFVLARYSGNELLRTFIHAHVDDMKIIGDEVAFVKAAISKHIKVTWKDGAEAKVFCGMEYAYSSSGAVLLHMHETVLSLLDLCEACGVDLSGIPDPSSPMLPGVAHELLRTYAPVGEVPLNDKFYRSTCGLCIWLECGVRPDISFALGVLTSALGKNTPAHDAALLRLIVWLRSTATHGLVYGGDLSLGKTGFMGWTDSSFADRLAARSTMGFVIKFNGSLIKWSSRKEPCVAQDTMEAEYIAASTYVRTLLGLLNLLADMLLEQGPVISFEDNSAAYGLIKHDLITRGARHINVRFNSVQEVERLKITDFRQCTTDEQLADLTTKALDPGKLARNLAALSFVSLVQFHSTYGD